MEIAKTNKSTDDKCRRLYEIALAMNKLQHYYSELFSVVGNQGRLVAESSVDLLKQSAFPADAYMLGKKLRHLKAEGLDRRLIRDLEILSQMGIKADHQDSASFRPTDKPVVVHAVFSLAKHLLALEQRHGWLSSPDS